VASTVRISLVVDGVVEFDRTFTRFAEQIEDLREIWPPVITEFRNVMTLHFRAQGAGRSGPWVRLSPIYAEWKRRRFPGKTILRRTDRLYRSLTGRTEDTVIRQGRHTLEIGTRVFYAGFHQRGTRTMPARRIFDLGEPQRVQLQRAIHKAMLKAVGRTFAGNTSTGFGNG